MSTNQPDWKLIANLGDENPLEHDGFFIYKDKTGVYEEEGEYIIVDNEWVSDDDKLTYTVYRIILERKENC